MAGAKDSGLKDTTTISTLQVPERGLNKQQFTGTIRRAQLAGVEFTADFVDAVATGWKSFRDQLNQSNQLLDGSVVRGSVEAAASFLEGVAKATRRSYDRYQTAVEDGASAPVPELDYERLATLVAAKLQNSVKQ